MTDTTPTEEASIEITPLELTAEQVAGIIEAFLNDQLTAEAWGAFIAATLADERLEWMREKCARMPEWYPPTQPGAYCGEPGLLLLRNFVDELRPTRHFIYALGKVSPYAHISDAAQGLYLYPTPLFHDPLAVLAEGVFGLLNKPQEEEPAREVVRWFEEPGEWRLVMTRDGSDVRLRVLWFGIGGVGHEAPETQGEQVFEATFPLLWFASQVRLQMRELIEVHGPDEYRRITQHDYPHAEYHRLTGLLRDGKGG